ncbi:hypothetical protein [Geotoga petraea]|uniref:Uncharacterized protein n=1 Tax=Geotoga petraea TaxID=28234 RepID=A0A4Z0VZX9_9BACT|nr:hypothetical protein [Geotoga petraea]TGG87575.1 hypothetical protein E4650_07465 [Geotoga petraea]
MKKFLKVSFNIFLVILLLTNLISFLMQIVNPNSGFIYYLEENNSMKLPNKIYSENDNLFISENPLIVKYIDINNYEEYEIKHFLTLKDFILKNNLNFEIIMATNREYKNNYNKFKSENKIEKIYYYESDKIIKNTILFEDDNILFDYNDKYIDLDKLMVNLINYENNNNFSFPKQIYTNDNINKLNVAGEKFYKNNYFKAIIYEDILNDSFYLTLTTIDDVSKKLGKEFEVQLVLYYNERLYKNKMFNYNNSELTTLEYIEELKYDNPNIRFHVVYDKDFEYELNINTGKIFLVNNEGKIEYIFNSKIDESNKIFHEYLEKINKKEL